MPLGGDETRVHYELLVRLRDENDRRVPPGAFMPSVDRYNLASRLDRWVISAAFSWLKRNLSEPA